MQINQNRQAISLQRPPATQEEAFPQDRENGVFGPMIIDYANLGEHSSGTHVVATMLGVAKDDPIRMSTAAADTAAASFGKVDPEQFGRALEHVQTHGASITSNSWGSDNSSSVKDAFAALQTDLLPQVEDGYIIRP